MSTYFQAASVAPSVSSIATNSAEMTVVTSIATHNSASPLTSGSHGHRPCEEVETGEEPAAVARCCVGVAGGPDIAHREDRRGRVEERHRHQEHDRQRVDPQPPAAAVVFLVGTSKRPTRR